MNGRSERANLRLRVTNALLLGAIGLASFPALVNPNVTAQATSALWRGSADCADGIEASNNQGFPSDAIAVPGAGIYKNLDGSYSATAFETRRIYAAALLWLSGQAPKIALLDGYQGEGVDQNVNREQLKIAVRQLSGNTKEITDEDIFSEATSVNTAENAEEMARMGRENNWKKVIVVTDDFHLLRSELLFCMNDIHTVGLSVEDVFLRWAPYLTEQISLQNISPAMKQRKIKEFFGILDILYTKAELSKAIKHHKWDH